MNFKKGDVITPVTQTTDLTMGKHYKVYFDEDNYSYIIDDVGDYRHPYYNLYDVVDSDHINKCDLIDKRVKDIVVRHFMYDVDDADNTIDELFEELVTDGDFRNFSGVGIWEPFEGLDDVGELAYYLALDISKLLESHDA